MDMNMNRYFLTPARRDRENIDLGDNNRSNLKDNLQSNRKHNNKKQAFGELKNIIHSIVQQDENINDKKAPIQEKSNKKPSLVSSTKIKNRFIQQDSGNNVKAKKEIEIKEGKGLSWESFKYEDYACALPNLDSFIDPQSVWIENICTEISEQLSNASLKQSGPKKVDDIEKIIDHEFGNENEIIFKPLKELDDFNTDSPKKLSLPKNENELLIINYNFDELEIPNLDDLE